MDRGVLADPRSLADVHVRAGDACVARARELASRSGRVDFALVGDALKHYTDVPDAGVRHGRVREVCAFLGECGMTALLEEHPDSLELSAELDADRVFWFSHRASEAAAPPPRQRRPRQRRRC